MTTGDAADDVPPKGGDGNNSVQGDRLRSLVERIERLEEEKRALADDVKEVYAEAKGVGFDVKALRALIARRRKDPDDLEEFEALLEVYAQALASAPADDGDGE